MRAIYIAVLAQCLFALPVGFSKSEVAAQLLAHCSVVETVGWQGSVSTGSSGASQGLALVLAVGRAAGVTAQWVYF